MSYIGADFGGPQILQSHTVGLVSNNIYRAHEDKKRATEKLHSFKRSQKEN